MPRDPRTLFFYWDHAPGSFAAARAGLDGARAELWLFERGDAGGFERCRATAVALESGSHYLHDLRPGRTYRAELRLAGRSGESHLLGPPSGEVTLPPLGPSSEVADAFARFPGDTRPPPGAAGSPFPEELRSELARLSDWSRFPDEVRGSSAGGMGGRPAPSSGTTGEEGR